MNIRFKILTGFILLIAMLVLAGALSILEYSKMSHSLQDLMKDNYKSIEASRSMLDALEQEENGVLLLVQGKWEQGRKTLSSGDSIFTHSFKIARNNITENHESALIDSIELFYQQYRRILERPIVGTFKEQNMEWYYHQSHFKFSKVKQAVYDLMSLNQSSMYKDATDMKEKAKRAIMPAIVAILAALIFSFLFNYFINHFFITPLKKLILQIERFSPDLDRVDSEIKTRDELRRLQNAVNELISKIKFNA
jgi:methyl-accepting chemotaxis protein